ncbi:DUF2512 family protein [Paenibacillus ginsengihumi]|uniref:DUF2512 family protein n=1 Tax=Paenibacillus ginsengihumi TaxID=431596 RepID=UPI000361B0C2|nr:DUF2512 family protein [Paenibacillus ginsengihumi]
MLKLITKLLLNGVVVVPFLLMFTEATFLQAMVAAVLLSLIAYAVGDQVVLRNTNSNAVASIADAGFAFLYFLLAGAMMDWSLTLGEMFVLAIGIGVIEWFFHILLLGTRREPA